MQYNNSKKIYEHINVIQEAINNKRNLAIFVGAGVSKNSNVPTWSEIINEFTNDLNIDKVSSSDYIKIAQCYFDTHPRKYKRLLNKYLNQDWETNCITRFLFEEFNPKYFITTNYDCILEKTAQELRNNSYKIVCKNEDIPEIKDKAIIKMHGDFKNNNIIFKETDYAEYSTKFKLVETFVKSIFATSIVLFVGFSADDPNVNQIYHWVKDILKNNKQPSYLILCDEVQNTRKNKIIKKYLENKDIYTLNFYEMSDIINNFYTQITLNDEIKETIQNLPSKGQELYKILYFLKYYSGNPISLINNRINIINKFNYIDLDDKYQYLFNDNCARFIQLEKKIMLYSSKIKSLIVDMSVSNCNVKFKPLKEFLINNSVEKIEYCIGKENWEVNVAKM